MKKLILMLIVSLALVTPPVSARQRSGRRASGAGRNLTLLAARRILNRQINDLTVDNAIFTCRACYSFDDKEENDNFAVVTTYPGMNQFLRRAGYIRAASGGDGVFTAKAKRSKHFEVFAGEFGIGGAGFRFANFRNPVIMVNRITDPKNVPIEYDRVPTEVTMEFFRKVERIKSRASFSYEDGKWSVCIACNN
jgi:hypothetical protein